MTDDGGRRRALLALPLAPQLLEAGADRLEVIGGAGLSHQFLPLLH